MKESTKIKENLTKLLIMISFFDKCFISTPKTNYIMYAS